MLVWFLRRDLTSQRFNVFQERELKTSLSDFLLSEFDQRKAYCSDGRGRRRPGNERWQRSGLAQQWVRQRENSKE